LQDISNRLATPRALAARSRLRYHARNTHGKSRVTNPLSVGAPLPPRERVDAPREAPWLRGLGVSLLALALALPLLRVAPRLDEVFVDGRMHLVWENARFLLRAAHSNTEPEPFARRSAPAWLRVFGTATYAYADDGTPSQLSFYSHHPVLVPALFRAWTRAFGTEPAAARSFALLFGALNALALYGFVHSAARSRALAGACALFYTLLPLPYQYVDVWKYETGANFLLLVALREVARAVDDGVPRASLLACLALLPHSDWNVYFAFPLLLWPLWRARRLPAHARVLRRAAIVLGGSSALNFALLYALGFDLATISAQGAQRMNSGAGGMTGWPGWALQQLAFLRANLGWSGVAIAGVVLALAIARPRLRRANHLFYGALCAAVSGLCWIAVFRNLSWIHPFVQWSFATALVLFVAGVAANGLAALRPLARIGLAAITAVALAATHGEADASDRRLRALAFGTPEDVAALWPLQCRRLLIAPQAESGPPHYWHESPVVVAALDPIWNRAAGRNCSVQSLEAVRELLPGDVIVAARAGDAAQRVRARVAQRFGGVALAPRALSPSFEFLEPVSGPASR
jgi:hypothetical protein